MLSGAAGSLAGLLPGFGLGMLVYSAVGHGPETVIAGLLVGGGLAAATAIWIVGSFLDGDGSFWATLAGTALGAVGTYFLVTYAITASADRSGPLWIPSIAAAVLGPLFGGALGFELTSHPKGAPAKSPATIGLEHAHLSPALLAGRDGAAMGFALGGTWR